MKKIFILVAIAGAMLGSCGNKTQKSADNLDSTEQMVFADSVMAQLDSMANIITQIADTSELGEIISEEKINLTADQKKIKPDYLITESDINDLQTLQQKYVAMAYLTIDQTVQKLYNDNDNDNANDNTDDDYYQHALDRMYIETNNANQAAADSAQNAPLTVENAKKFYADMKKRGCVDKFYIAEAAYLVEALYVISRNVDIYMPAISDQTAANISLRLATTINGVNIIAANHPELQPVVAALTSIKGINATTSAQLKQQIVKANSALTAARKAMLDA